MKLDPEADLYPQDAGLNLEPEIAARWYAYFEVINKGQELAKRGQIEEAITTYEEAGEILDLTFYEISASA